jgi:hypothetical protein
MWVEHLSSNPALQNPDTLLELPITKYIIEKPLDFRKLIQSKINCTNSYSLFWCYLLFISFIRPSKSSPC